MINDETYRSANPFSLYACILDSLDAFVLLHFLFIFSVFFLHSFYFFCFYGFKFNMITKQRLAAIKFWFWLFAIRHNCLYRRLLLMLHHLHHLASVCIISRVKCSATATEEEEKDSKKFVVGRSMRFRDQFLSHIFNCKSIEKRERFQLCSILFAFR